VSDGCSAYISLLIFGGTQISPALNVPGAFGQQPAETAVLPWMKEQLDLSELTTFSCSK
jgi:hypothetical protein